MKDRITIRRNAREQAELELFLSTYGIQNQSDGYKTAVRWCNQYIKNVTDLFFPATHNVLLVRKKKTEPKGFRFWD